MIQYITVGMLQEHAYFFIDEETKHGFLVDPGAEAERILKKIQDENWTIEKILITHGHFDHIGAAIQIREQLACKIVIHEEGSIYLQQANWNLSEQHGINYTLEADEYVKHGDVITLAANPAYQLEVIHIPGHTLDGVAYYTKQENVAFVGDIIFKGAIGRSDFPGGDMQRLVNGIRERLFTLCNETILLTGHGPHTTVEHEKATNPFFNH